MCRWIFIVAVSLPLGVVNATDIDDYRLAGTIQLPSDAHIAIVEVSGSRQQLLRVGDQITAGAVELIRDGEVHIRFGSETLVLTLEGRDIAVSGEAVPGLIVASLDVGAEDIREISELAGHDEDELAAQLAVRLSLPDDLTVARARVAGQEFFSLTTALPEIRRALATGEFAHLFFEAGGSIDEVYLMPTNRPK